MHTSETGSYLQSKGHVRFVPPWSDVGVEGALVLGVQHEEVGVGASCAWFGEEQMGDWAASMVVGVGAGLNLAPLRMRIWRTMTSMMEEEGVVLLTLKSFSRHSLLLLSKNEHRYFLYRNKIELLFYSDYSTVKHTFSEVLGIHKFNSL